MSFFFIIFVVKLRQNNKNYNEMIKEKVEEFVNDILYNPGNKKLTCDTVCYNPNSPMPNYLLLGCEDYSVLTYSGNWIDVKVETFGGYELTQDDKDRIKDIQDNLQKLWRLVSNCYDIEKQYEVGIGLDDIVVGNKNKVDPFNE